MTTPRIEIRSHKPGQRQRKFYWFALAVAAAIGVFFGGYFWAGLDNASLRQMLSDRDTSITRLDSEKQELGAKVAQLQRGQQVTGIANEEVRGQLRDLQQEILELREEIAFYRGIVAPSESTTGVRIQRMELIPLSEERLFRYRLILTQVLKNNHVTRGGVDVAIVGVMDGGPKQYSLQEIAAEPIKPLKFRFKYFQKFEGDIMLPEGFLPHTVTVTVKPSKAKSHIEESFDWPAPVDIGSV